MRPISFTYAPSSSDDDGIALAQQLVAAGYLTLNGVFVSDGVATMGDQQIVTLTSTSNLSALTALITGKDKPGNSITETVTLGNSAAVSSTKNFYKVESIYVNGVVAADMRVGVSGLGQSQPYPLDIYKTPFSVSNVVDTVVGPPTYKAQYTYDNVFYQGPGPNGVSYAMQTQHWFDSASMTGKSAAFAETISAPIQAVRFAITTQAASQSISGRIIQAG